MAQSLEAVGPDGAGGKGEGEGGQCPMEADRVKTGQGKAKGVLQVAEAGQGQQGSGDRQVAALLL